MTDIFIPELSSNVSQWIRIPAELDVPVTPRVQAILDSAPMRRLAKISQLGLVGLVYPGATHSRLEHSLGVYRLATLVLGSLMRDRQIAEMVDERAAKTFLVASLVHDIGHWPYCHPLEDMRLDWIPVHERNAEKFLCQAPLCEVIRSQWQIEPEDVARFLQGKNPAAAYRFLYSLLSGPIDVDKMDYLQRDSLHAGVPYGRNFDIGRLIHCLCPGPQCERVAITEKGKTAAEMMVFARYIMFSEVYWHHAVRSATAMLQRAVYELSLDGNGFSSNDLFQTTGWSTLSEFQFTTLLVAQSSHHKSMESIVHGLFGDQRRLYKRLAQFNFAEDPAIHARYARKPYVELVRYSRTLAERLCSYSPQKIDPIQVLIDAPPVKLEVQFNLDVRHKRSRESDPSPGFESLTTVSPVVRTLATEQFDNFVKRVRVFVAPEVMQGLKISQEQLTKEMLEICGE
jgi:uncharacterized protein